MRRGHQLSRRIQRCSDSVRLVADSRRAERKELTRIEFDDADLFHDPASLLYARTACMLELPYSETLTLFGSALALPATRVATRILGKVAVL